LNVLCPCRTSTSTPGEPSSDDPDDAPGGEPTRSDLEQPALVRERPDDVVWAPGFERVLEQPLAGVIPIGPEVDLVVTEGNYLLLDRPAWRAVRAELDEVWFLDCADDVRRPRLVARHVEFGKSPVDAEAWVARVDDANAALVAPTRAAADRVVRL
jgi:pantothenate kinase